MRHENGLIKAFDLTQWERMCLNEPANEQKVFNIFRHDDDALSSRIHQQPSFLPWESKSSFSRIRHTHTREREGDKIGRERRYESDIARVREKRRASDILPRIRHGLNESRKQEESCAYAEIQTKDQIILIDSFLAWFFVT